MPSPILLAGPGAWHGRADHAGSGPNEVSANVDADGRIEFQIRIEGVHDLGGAVIGLWRRAVPPPGVPSRPDAASGMFMHCEEHRPPG